MRRYGEIVFTLAQRDFTSRFRGNWLGILGLVVVPLLFLTTYTFVFSTLMPVKIRPDASRTDYAFFFFAGLIGWTLFAESTARAPRLFTQHVHFVRKALFPVSALPAASALAAAYNAAIWLVVYAAVRLLHEGTLPLSVLAAPLLLVLLMLLATGIGLILAACGALARDWAELVAPLLAVGMFVTPVIYPAEHVAKVAPWLLTWNPLAAPIEALRGSLFDGRWPAPAEIGTTLLWTAAILACGVLVHRRVRPLLGDLL
jgi:lipopolysaccharide transport system permease protein